MKFTILTLFPDSFSYFWESIIKKAIEREKIEIEILNIRDFSSSKHKTVDDIPYWWWQWMVLMCQPIFDAIYYIKQNSNHKKFFVVFPTPRWKKLTQKKIEKFSKKQDFHFIIICWRYEWIDQRIVEKLVDEEISIWDYILTWWEIPAMILVDSIARLIDWVLWKNISHEEESFSKKLLWKKEFPYYTRPENFRDLKVPEILLSWNHKEIEKWKIKNLK